MVAGDPGPQQRVAAGRPGRPASGCAARSSGSWPGCPTVERIDTLLTMQLGPDDILVAAKVDFRDEATGARDRGRRRRGRAAAHRPLPGDPVRLPRPHPFAAGRHRVPANRPGRADAGGDPPDLSRARPRRPDRLAGPGRRPAHPGAGRRARAASVPVMVRWRSGTVATLRRQWTGAVELDVDLPDGTRMRALAYPELVGTPEPGDRVLLNAGALLMGLGTGGYALVVALPDRLPPDPPDVGDTRDAGHLVKARYTPLQPILLGVDEEASPHRAVLADADDLGGLPVVTADLHSALPAILAGIRADAPQARVAYLLTDGGALPAWFSRTLDGLRGRPGRHGHRRAGVRRRPGGHHPAQRSARRPARAPRGRGDRRSGPRQPGHRHPVGLLRRRGRRGGQRGRHAGRAAGRLAAHLRRRPPPPAPGRVPSQPHRVRPGGAGPGGAGGARRPGAAPSRPRCTRRWRRWRPGTGSSGCAPTVSTPRCGPAPVPLSTMGRGLDADHAYFLAAAAAGRHAATLLP